MRPQAGLACGPLSWHGRQAFVLENDLIRLTTLTGGGHIAEFRFREGSGPSTVNPLWIPPWKTIEPYQYREKTHTAVYGPPKAGEVERSILTSDRIFEACGWKAEVDLDEGLVRTVDYIKSHEA